MNARILGIVISLSWLAGSAAHAFQTVAAEPVADETGVLMAADFVQAALQAEAEGDAARREALLREALDKDPDYAPARWHSGYVRLNDAWVSLPQSQRTFRLDPRVADYQQVRASLAESPAKDLLLARWCQEKKLSEEARFHWLNVLRAQPNHEEALRTLEVQWYNGQLLTREQVAEQKQADFKASRNTLNSSNSRKRRWETTIASWERAAAQGEQDLLAKMEADLAAEESPAVIPMFNILLGERSRAPRDPEAFEVVSLNWLKILAKDPSHTKFLVLHAIGHPLEAVRSAAADELKTRPREEYVPLLLTCARFPVEFACSLLLSGGLNSVQTTLDIQGLESDTQIEHVGALVRVAGLDSIIKPFENGSILTFSGGETPDQAAYWSAWQGAAAAKTRAMENYLDRYNAVSAVINQRITEALARATGEDLESNPRVWQAWWEKYQGDYYELDPHQDSDQGESGARSVGGQNLANESAGSQRQQRPLQKFSTVSVQNYVVPPVTQNSGCKPRSGGQSRPTSSAGGGSSGMGDNRNFDMTRFQPHSCFKGSTLVWTITGPRPIEGVLPGDRVLSQNPSTGELAFKMVQTVTKAKPAPMMKIAVGGEEIVSTLGHPFWVVGQRWTMAKHLQEGSLLHSVSGPVRIESVEEIPAATAWYEFSYNLQVDDFHTFFVGENQVLVHHLTMLSILDEGSSIVPGL